MELTTAAQLWFFAALFGGLILGAGIGRLTRFDLGMAIGLLLPGIVALSFSAQCAIQYRAFTTDAPGVGDR